MPFFFGGEGDDRFSIGPAGTWTVSGGWGIDSLSLGALLRSDVTIVLGADGTVNIDSLPAATAVLHLELQTLEWLRFDDGQVNLDLRSFFGAAAGPSLQITDNVPGAATGTVRFTLTFSEPITGLSLQAFEALPSGSLAIEGSGAVYTVTYTPMAGVEADVALRLLPGSVHNAGGVANAFGAEATQSVDTWVRGTAGNDRINAPAGNQRIDGGAGIDTLVLPGARSAYPLTHSGLDTTVLSASTDHSALQLHSVERLAFRDGAVALDTGLTGHAGITAMTLGAVFGADAVHAHPEYVGLGLKALDAGTDALGLMQLALDARLGAGASHRAVVDLLYANVLGSAPTHAQAAPYVALLDVGVFTSASLGLLAALSPENQAHIGLMGAGGLQDTGLAYVPA